MTLTVHPLVRAARRVPRARRRELSAGDALAADRGVHARRRARRQRERRAARGRLLEMMALETLPVGASRYPEWGSASVVGGALYVTRRGDATSALLFAMLGAMITAWVGGWSMYALRRLNGRWTKRALPALEAGNARVVTWLQMRGLGADLVRGFVLTALALALLVPLTAVARRARPRRLGHHRARCSSPSPRRWPGAPRGSSRTARSMGRWFFVGGLAVGCAMLLQSLMDNADRSPAPVAHRAAAMFVRMLAMQASWNYETMLGNGHRLLRRAGAARAARRSRGPAYHAALARETHYFNAHPYLAAVAVGALARVGARRQHAARADRALPHRALRPARERRRSARLGGLAAVHRARRAARVRPGRGSRARGDALPRALQRGALRRCASGGFAPGGRTACASPARSRIRCCGRAPSISRAR